MPEELDLKYGLRKLKKYARRKKISLNEAYTNFKKFGAGVGWNERNKALLEEFDMKHALAGMMFREIPEEEIKALTEEAVEAGRPEVKRQLLLNKNFDQFKALSEMEKVYKHIKQRTARYIRDTLRGIFRVCQKLSKYYGRTILPKELIDPDTAKTLIEDYIDAMKERYIETKIKPVARQTGEPVEVVYRDMPYHSAKLRMPIRVLEMAHGKSPLISGEKDPTRARVLRLKEMNGAELIAEEIVERLTKGEFKGLLAYFDVSYDLKDALEFKGLSSFLGGTASRIGMTRITGALSIRIKDIHFDREPIMIELYEKTTKAKGRKKWKKLLPAFSKLRLLAYLENRYGTTEWAKIKKTRRRDYLFPRKYAEYREVFRKAFDDLGLTGITHPFHCFRHSWVDWMVATPLGENPLALSRLGGWDDVSTMIKRYFGDPDALLDKWFNKAKLRIEE